MTKDRAVKIETSPQAFRSRLMRTALRMVGISVASAAFLSLTAIPSAARVVFPSPFELSTLNGRNGFVVNGINGGHWDEDEQDFTGQDESGYSVSGAGDVNGDGVDDFIIGANHARQSYVVFGRRKGSRFPAALELSSLNGNNGFVLNGFNNNWVGYSVSGAGDVNGDGLDDLIVGAPWLSHPGPGVCTGPRDAGQSYVVFGRPKSSPFPRVLELSTLDGSNGFLLNGVADDASGLSVSGAGDVNGDGVNDLLIGAPWFCERDLRVGQSYLVFGRPKGSPFPRVLELSTLDGSNGFVLNGVAAGDTIGLSVSGAGDINGDGLDDLLIGGWTYDLGGQTYVVFGRPNGSLFPAVLELSSLDGSNGFVFKGGGYSVSGAGDVNGDGLDDLLTGQSYPPQSYLVFGRPKGSPFPAVLEVSSLDGSNGFVVNGGDVAGLGFSVSGVGDVNGDGADDLIIGAPWAYPHGKPAAGQSYLVFGRPKGVAFPAVLEVPSLDGNNGFLINGMMGERCGFAYCNEGDMSGYSVSRAGDINGDGLDDLVIGAPGADPHGKVSAGQSYVVFGRPSLPDTTPPSCAMTGGGTNALGQRFVEISCQDKPRGLASIQTTTAANYTVEIPSFTVGTTKPVVVTATKFADKAQSTWVTLKLRDRAGHVGFYYLPF